MPNAELAEPQLEPEVEAGIERPQPALLTRGQQVQFWAGIVQELVRKYGEWEVTFGFHLDGQHHWFAIALSIHALTALVFGSLFLADSLRCCGGRMFDPEVKMGRYRLFGIDRCQRALFRWPCNRCCMSCRMATRQKCGCEPCGSFFGLHTIAGFGSGMLLPLLELAISVLGLGGIYLNASFVKAVGPGIKTKRELDTIQIITFAPVLYLELLPTLLLHSFVAVSLGALDPSDYSLSQLGKWFARGGWSQLLFGEDNLHNTSGFDPVLASTIFLSVIKVGQTLYRIEVTSRARVNGFQVQPEGQGMSKYGLIRVLAGTAAATALVFSVALFACSFKGWALLVVVPAIPFFGWCAMATHVGHQSGIRDKKLSRRWKNRGDVLRAGWQRRLCFILVAAFALGGALAALFLNVDHLPNNYLNETLPASGPGDPQHGDCKDRTSGIYPAILGTTAAIVLIPLSWTLDPQVKANVEGIHKTKTKKENGKKEQTRRGKFTERDHPALSKLEDTVENHRVEIARLEAELKGSIALHTIYKRSIEEKDRQSKSLTAKIEDLDKQNLRLKVRVVKSSGQV